MSEEEMSDVMPLDYPAEKIETDKKVRQAIWDIIGECMTGIDDSEKILRIEKLLLDSEI
jgi:hypothetical protein